MKRSDRIGTVARIREVQEQIAETEAIRRRRDADERRADERRAVESVAARNSIDVGAALSFTELARRRTVLEGAAAAAEQEAARRVRADEELARAQSDWHDAHRRHDAVDRLHERVVSDEAREDDRRSQALLDDLVAARHRRPPSSPELT